MSGNVFKKMLIKIPYYILLLPLYYNQKQTNKRKTMSLAYNQDLSKLPGLAHGSTFNSDNPFEPFFGPTSVQDNQNVRAEDVFSHEST